MVDESDTDDDVEIIEHRMNQRKTGSRMYFDKPKTRLIALAHGR